MRQASSHRAHARAARASQDIVCRYAHQTGHYVERRFGWDCHGLPVEFEIDKMLGIKGAPSPDPNPGPSPSPALTLSLP